MKKSGEMGDEAWRLKMRRQIRTLNCMKMYGLGTTSRGYFIVRDHRSRGEPIFFWRHSLTGNGKEAETWKESTDSDGDGIGWVLKIPGDLDLENDVGTNPDEIGVLQPVDGASPTSHLWKEALQTCFRIVGVVNSAQLIAALRKYKDDEEAMLKVLGSKSKLAAAKEEHITDLLEFQKRNPALKAVIANSTGKATSSERGGKRNNKPGKNERLLKKLKSMGEVSATSSFCSPMHPKQ
jgi:hypothetical protein